MISNIKTADENITAVTGLVSFEIVIGDHSYNCDASVVPNLAYQVVLGCDFLHANDAINDIKQECVTFKSNNTVIFTKYGNSSTVANVHSAKTCVIDSQCEVIIPAYLSKTVDSVVGLVEANHKCSDAYHLMGASTLAIPDQDNCATSRFINPNDTPVLLH